MGKKGSKVFFRAILAIFIFSAIIPLVLSECNCDASTPYCSGTCTLSHYDPISESTIPASCDSCTACPYNDCQDASNPDPEKNICLDDTCVECTTRAQCIAKNGGDQNYYCNNNQCDKICEYYDAEGQPVNCNAICSGSTSGACSGGSGAPETLYSQIIAPNNWKNRSNDYNMDEPTGSWNQKNINESGPGALTIDYLRFDGIRYHWSDEGLVYNCGETADCTPRPLKSILPSSNTNDLCKYEGTYYFNMYTQSSSKTISGGEIYQGAVLPIYVINAQLSEDLCTCAENIEDPNTGYPFSDSKQPGPYTWSGAAKNSTLTGGGAMPFGCCGPLHQSNISLDITDPATKTSCQVSSNEKYLCSNKSSIHPNEWLVAKLTDEYGGPGNIGCAYQTGCDYWVLSNESQREDGTLDAKWLKCDASNNPNNPNMLTITNDSWYSQNSLGCFKTTTASDTFKIYECRNTMTVVGGANPICPANRPGAVDDVIPKHTDKTGAKNTFIYVNSTDGMYFCLQNGSFQKDLDTPDGITPINITAQTCEMDGFTWTGSKCCGESDQFIEFPTGEFYNDLSQDPIELFYSNTIHNGRKAGCWNGTVILSGKRLNDTNAFPKINPSLRQVYDSPSVINYNGTFYGCNLSSQIFYNGQTIDNPLLELKSSYEKTASTTSDYLIKQGSVQGTVAGNIDDPSNPTNLVVCSSLLDAAEDRNKNYSYYCAMDNTWKQMEQKQNMMTPKETRPDLMTTTREDGNPKLKDLPKYDCCPRTRCWNGTVCINSTEEAYRINQSIYASIQASTADPDKAYICVEGGQDSSANWTEFTGYKSTWDMHYEGVCSKKSQCLVEKAGNPSLHDPADYFSATAPSTMPKCIDDQEYIEDHYCNNGNWTTRTKLVAEHLAENIGSGDYSLFCDTPKNALNKIDYTMGNNYVKNYFSDGTSTIINNFCVLKTADKLIFGTSLNKNIEETGFPDIIGVSASSKASYCASGTTDGAFTICSNSGNWKVYYDKAKQLLIFTKDTFTTIQPSQTFEKRYGINDIIIHIRDLTTYPSQYSNNDATFYNATHDYSTIYSMKKGAKSAIAFKESNHLMQKGWSAEYMAAKYVGFQNADVCNYIIYYIRPPQSGDVPSTTVCDGGDDNTYTYYAFGSSDSDDGRGLLNAWTDLTAKMRVN